MSTKTKRIQSAGASYEKELVPGTKLFHGQYEIEHFLNNGGFGITYLAKDSLNRSVVVKECFPDSICRRENTQVKVRSRGHAEAFQAVLELFIEEAHNLARLSHPNIVGVHQVFEDNGTAYMAMDFVEGRDLLEITDDDARLEPKTLEQIVLKLLSAVEYIHDAGILHRDIAPDNILIDRHLNPVLIDFGAARDGVSQKTSKLASMRTVKDGYSPQEFYTNTPEQHPSADLYSLAASLYHVITGELPVSAQTRLMAIAADEQDPYVPIRGQVKGYSAPFLEAIDLALNVFPKDRLQSAGDWREILTETSLQRNIRSAVSVAVDNVVSVSREATSRNTEESSKLLKVKTRRSKKAGSTVSVAATQSGRSKQGGKTGGMFVGVAAVALLAVAGGAGYYFLAGGDASEQVATTAGGSSFAQPGAPADTASMVDLFTRDAEVTGSSANRLSAADETGLPEPTVQTRIAPAPAAAPAEPAGIAEDAESPVVTELRLDLALTADVADPSLIGSASGALSSVLSSGDRVVSVNGTSTNTVADVARVASAQANLTAGGVEQLVLVVEDPVTGQTSVQNVDVPTVLETALANGVAFETRRVDQGWSTIVTAASGASPADLQRGDVIIALLPGNERLDDPNALPRFIQQRLLDGETQLNFSVERDGAMWFAGTTYEASTNP